jgi:hypothetical protein
MSQENVELALTRVRTGVASGQSVNVKHFIGVACAASVVLVGCYGETRPATDVTPNSARLHGHFTADKGPALSWFEYWKTSEPDTKWEVGFENRADGESAPVEADAPLRLGSAGLDPMPSRLRYGTSYSFRLCGRDQGGPPACAQTETFTTPVGDAVEAYLAFGFQAMQPKWYVRGSSSPTGQNPQGSLHESGAHEFNGFISCLAVSGHRAAVGAVGYGRDAFPGDDPSWVPETQLLSIQEDPNNPNGASFKQVVTAGSTRPNCSTASFENLIPPSFPRQAFIQDAPGG